MSPARVARHSIKEQWYFIFNYCPITLISLAVKGSGLSGVSLSPRRSHSFISHGGGRDFLFANPSHPTSSKYMDLHIEVVTIYFLP